MSGKGFIVLDRSLLEWQWHDNMIALGLWTHILLKANWKDGYFMGELIPRGSFATSISHLAEEIGLHPNTVNKWLKRFEEIGQIERKATNRYTVIKVINYAKFQDLPEDYVKQRVEQNVKRNVEQDVEQNVKQRVDNRTNKQINKETREQIHIVSDAPEIIDNDDAWFREFWKLYPKHKAKSSAEKSFKRKCQTAEDFDTIMTGLRSVIENEWKNRDPQYIPYPATWLNQERWSDDITPRKKSLDERLMEEHLKNEQGRNDEDPGDNPFGVPWD